MDQDPLEELELEQGEPRLPAIRTALLIVFMASCTGAFFVIIGLLLTN